MLRIYNSNFRTNKQRLIAAIVIGGIAAVLSAAILAFFCSKIKRLLGQEVIIFKMFIFVTSCISKYNIVGWKV